MEFIKRDSWIDVLNNGKVVNSVTVYNKAYSYDLVIELLDRMYKHKDEMVNVLKAMMNKYKIKQEVCKDDVQRLVELYNKSEWNINNKIAIRTDGIVKSFRNNDYEYVNMLATDVYYMLKHSHVKMEMDDFYLMEVY